MKLVDVGLDPLDGRPGARRLGPRTLGVLHASTPRWTFEADVFDHHAVWMVSPDRELLIARQDLHDLLPDLHTAGEGWTLVIHQDRLLTAEWGIREHAETWEPARLLNRWLEEDSAER